MPTKTVRPATKKLKQPPVLAPYGFRTLTLNGEEFLVVMTKRQAIAALKASGQRFNPKTLGTCQTLEGGACRQNTCSGVCRSVYLGGNGAWICLCE